MPDTQDFNTIFSKRLRYYLEIHDISQVELAKRLGVGTTSVYNWCNGIKTPRMDKVDKMCEIFGCRRTDFMEDVSSSPITSPLPLTEPEQSLIGDYRMLNHTGKAEAGKRVHELTQIDIYKKDTALSDDMGIA